MAAKERKKGETVPFIQESCSNEAMKQIKLAASGKDQRTLLEEKSNKRRKSNRT